MPIEASVTVIDDLNASYPENGDAIPFGANHLRNLKTAVKSLNTAASTKGAAQVAFLQQGTGALTTRKVQDKLRERISVKDFGAVGDGTTDDTAAIQAAVDAVAALNYKALYFPAGSYKLTGDIVFTGSNWDIYGDGKAATTILGGYDGDLFVIDCAAATYRYGLVRDMTFQRVNATYGNTYAIHVKGATIAASGLRHWTFRDLRFMGVEYGIYYDDAGDYATSSGATISGGHGFNEHINLETPVELNARYPYATIRWAGALGPHERIFGGQYRSRYASVMIGSGAASQIQGDFLMCGVHCVLGDYAIEILGPTGASAYKYNFSVTGCQFDVLNLGTLKASNIKLFRCIGNNNITSGGIGAVIDASCDEYVYEDGMSWNFKSTTNNKAFSIDHPVTISQNLTHDGVRAKFNGWMSIGSESAKTISSGAITADSTNTIVDTEAAAAADDLDTISGGADDDLLILSSASSARDVTVRHIGGGTGNIRLNGAASRVLSSVSDQLMLRRRGGLWVELSFSDNAT